MKGFCIFIFILFSLRLSAQLEHFNIEIPYSGTTSILTIDDKGFLWFSIENNADYCRYHGQGLTEVHLAELYDLNATKLEIDNPIFIDGKLLVQTNTEFALLDLSDRTLTDIWTYPSEHQIDYYILDDFKNLIVFTTNKNDNTRPVYKRQPNGDFELQFDLSKSIGKGKIYWWSELSMIGEEFYFHNRFQDLIILDKLGTKKELDLEDKKEYEDKIDCSMFRVDNMDNLWRIYKDTYAIYDAGLRKFVDHPVSGKLVLQTNCTDMSTFNFELNKILVDKKNRVWFAGGHSNVMMYDPKTNSVISFTKKITDIMGGNNGDVHDLEEDKYGNIFGSKRGGVFKISETEQLFDTYAVNTNNEDHQLYDYTNDQMFEQVVNYLKPSNIVRTNISSVVEKDDAIYFSDYRFVYKIDKESNQAKVMPFYHPVTKIAMYAHNDKLISAAWSELFLLDDSYQPQKLDFTPSKLDGIFQQKNGDTWMYGYLSQNVKTSQQKTFFAKVDSQTLAFSGNYIDPSGAVNFDSLLVLTVEENDNGDAIEVKSILDVGTEFKVYLPIHNELSENLVESIFEENNGELNQFLTEKESRSLGVIPAEATSYDFDESHPVLLLIEDNVDVTTYIISILKDQYQIVLAENGEIGIDKAIETVPDIIISDVMMPIKDGFEVCKTLKQHATTDHIPIILLTAKSTISDKVEGLKYGADAYLSKPFHKEELQVRLEQLLLIRKKNKERYSQQIIAPINTEPSKEDVYYHKLKSIVFDNLSDNNFGVPELALQMLMSQTQLFRKTKALLDRTPAILIRSVRLEEAKKMLSETDTTITNIAQNTGFRDPSYFSRAFSKEYGTSPSDFRKQLNIN